MSAARSARTFIPACALLAACSFSPLTNRIKVGDDDIVVFVAEGVDGNTDLFISPTAGGTPTQLTYTVAVEMLPRLSPDGGVLAFVRARDSLGGGARLIAMNLLNGNERSVTLPDDIGRPLALGWGTAPGSLYLRTTTGRWKADAPPAPFTVARLAGADPAADTALAVWLGEPRFARAEPCAAGGVCVIGAAAETTIVSRDGTGALRWGMDSVAWFEGPNLIVRGLGPGPARRVTWRKAPERPRDATYAKGSGVRRDSIPM